MLPKEILCSYCLVLTFLLCSADKKFVLESRWPPISGKDSKEATWKLKAGSKTTFKCTSSEKFQLCRWARPNSDDSCSIFGNDKSNSAKPCPSDDWTIEKMSDDKTCSLTISSVKEGIDEGKWICNLQSYPSSKDNHYNSVEATTNLQVIQPAKVELKGPSQIQVTVNTEKTFTCVATGLPKPVRLEWILGDSSLKIDDSQSDSDTDTDHMRQEMVSAKVMPEWNAKELKCISVQIDDEGNEVRASDVRTLKVVERMEYSVPRQGQRGDFNIVDKFPKDPASIMIAPDEKVTFFCTSNDVWDVCRWKRPNSEEPCGLLSYDISPNSCRKIWTDHLTSAGEWTLRKESPTTCSITGSAVNIQDVGEWNCHLQSKPISSGEHSTYDSDQMYFEVTVIRPTRLVATDFPNEIEAVDGTEVKLSIQVTDANPVPTIQWFINTTPVTVRIIDKTEPGLNSYGSYSYSLTIGYIVHLEDTGKRLICKATQTDALGREVAVGLESLLTVKAPPPQEKVEGLGVAVIAIIVSCGAFLLLVLILLCVAFRTGRWCFKQPTQLVYIEKEANRAEQGVMECQTDSGLGTDASIGADFGPGKPRRVDFRDENEYEPLIEKELPLGSDDSEIKRADKFCDDNFVNDETTEYKFEGSDSLATSLSSLNTNVSERDWEETFRALGPVFVDMLEGTTHDDSDSSETFDETSDGTEI